MSMKKFRVYGLGQCALDYLGKISTYPEADSKCEFTGLHIQGGGPVATALVALQRWGIASAFCGVVGNDNFGNQILTELHSEKIDVEDVLIRNGESSQFAFVIAEAGHGRRTIFWRRPTGADPTATEMNVSRILSAELLHTDGIFSEATLHACKVANSAKIPISVDAGSMREGMLEIAACSEFFLASATFAEQFLGRDDPGIACDKLAGLGPRVVCVTLGEEGYMARNFRGMES
jgi:ribokinase